MSINFKTIFSSYIRIALVVILAAVLVVVCQLRAKAKIAELQKQAAKLDLEIVMPYFPEVSQVLASEGDDSVYEIYNQKHKQLGTAISSEKFSSDIIGYAGPVPLILFLDSAGVIKGIHLLENSETESFLKHIRNKGFFDRWNGLTFQGASQKNIETVTAATLSTSAIKNNINRIIQKYGGIDFVAEVSTPRMPLYKMLLAFAVIAFALYCFFTKSAKIRILLLLSNIIVIGILCGSLLSLAVFEGWLKSNPFAGGFTVLLLIAALSLILPIITGKNFYCNFLCPYGAAQELTSKISKKNLKLPKKTGAVLSYARIVLLLGAYVIVLLDLSFDLTSLEPFAAFAFTSASIFVITLAALFLIVSIVLPKCWCRYFCPTGFIINSLRRKYAK